MPGLAARLLGGHVTRGAHDGTAGRLVRLIHFLGEAEVGDLQRTLRAQQDIGRLQVAMQHALLMGRGHGQGQRPGPLSRQGRRLRLAAEPISQVAAGAELQRKVGLALVLADFVNLHDVGVL